MPTEGPGILQNEAARSSLESAGSHLGDLLSQMSGYGLPTTPFHAEYEAAIVFLWMRFARGSFRDPRRETFMRQVAAAKRLLPATLTEAHSALDAYVAGDEPLVRWTALPPRLASIFYGSDADHLSSAERGWADAPARVFELGGAMAVAQQLADEVVLVLDEDFDAPGSRKAPRSEAYGIGQLALLLVLEGIHVDPRCFARWRDVWHAGRAEPSSDLARAFDVALDDAFAFGIERFS